MAYIRDVTTLRKHKISRRDKVEFAYLKIRSCHTFMQPDLNLKMESATRPKIRKNPNALVLMDFVTIIRRFLKQLDAILFSVLVKKLDLAVLIMISNEEPRKEKKT